MAALTQDRNTPRRIGYSVAAPLAAGAVIYSGGMFTLDAAGNAKASVAADKKPVHAVATVRAVQAEGAELAHGERTVFRLDNAEGAAAITRAQIGSNAFVVDDQTVGKAGTSIAGEIIDVDDAGVWVDIGKAAAPTSA